MSTKPNTSITSTNDTKALLEKGEMVNVSGAPYIVGGVNDGQVQLTHCNTNVILVFTWKQIEEEFLKGTITFPERSGAGVRVGTANDNFQYSLDLCPEADMEQALRFKEYMEAIFKEYPGRIPTEELLRISYEVAEKIADPSVPSKDTLRRYLKRWKNSGGDIRSLLPLTHKRGNRTQRLDPDINVMMHDAITNVYARPEQTSTTAVYNALCDMLTKTNKKLMPQDRLLVPSKKTLLKAIRKRMGPDMLAARKGKSAANRQYRPVYQRPRATKPLDRVQTDTKTLDVFVIHNGVRKRAYLTSLLDEYSACVVGYYIGLEPSCAENTLKCLHHAINVKDSRQIQEGLLNNSYDCYGLFDELVADNGIEIKNAVAVHVLSQFGVNIQWCGAATPEQKGQIERFHRTIDLQLFHDLPGTTKGNIKDRGDYKSKDEATLTLESLREIFEKYIVDVYHQSYHRGVKGKPAQLWADGLAGMPPRMPGSILDLTQLLPNIDTRTIQSKGIEFMTNFYNSPELAQVRNGEKGKTVRIRWVDTDLSQIFVENPDTRRYFKVPSVNFAKTRNLTVEAQEAEMREENDRRRAADQDPVHIKSKGELSNMIEAARTHQKESKTTFDPYGKESKEVLIQRQNAEILPSGEGYDDLAIGSDLIRQEASVNDSPICDHSAANENVFDADNFDGWQEQNGRSVAKGD